MLRPSRRPRFALGAGAAALAFAVGSARPAHASPEDILGFGARSSAMGATGAAGSEGYEATYNNPALLSLARDREITVGFTGALFNLYAAPGAPAATAGLARFTTSSDRISYAPLHGTVIGATLPLPFGGVLKDRLAVGLGFFTPTDLIVRGRILYPETPQFPIADRAQSVAVQAALGVHVFRGLRIGGGFAALAALSGTVQVATDASGRIGTVVEDTLVASYGPILGASYDIGDTWRVGLAYRGALVGRFNVVINVKDLGSIVVPPLNISGVAQYDPPQVAVEFAKVNGPLRFSVGATFKRWSAYPGAAEATVRCPQQDPNGMPFSGMCDALVPPPPNYHDTVSGHAGVEQRFRPTHGVDMAARGGVFFEPTPAPAQTGASNLFDNHRLAFTAGYGLALGSPLPRISIDLFAQAQILIPRENDKASGTDPTTPGFPAVRTSGTILASGMTIGVKF